MLRGYPTPCSCSGAIQKWPTCVGESLPESPQNEPVAFLKAVEPMMGKMKIKAHPITSVINGTQGAGLR
jgi:hypothetical protein